MLFFAILDLFLSSSFPLLALLRHLDLAVSVLLFVLAAVHAPLALPPLVLLLAVGISPFQFAVAFLKQAARQAIRRGGCISLFHARRQLCSVARLVHICLKEFVADQIATVAALASDPAVHAAAWFAIDASIIGVKVSHAFWVYALDDIKAVSRRELVEDAASTGIVEIEFSPPATSQAEGLAVTDSEARAASITSQASLESLADIFLNWFAEDTADDSVLLPSLSSSDSVVDPSMFSDTEILPSPPSSPCAQTPTRTLNAAASVFTPKRSLAAATKARRLSPLAAAFTPGLPTPPATPTVVRTRPVAARGSVAGSEVASESESKAFVTHSTPVSKRLDPHVAAFVPQVRTPLNPRAAAFAPTGALLPENEASDKSSPSASVALNPLAKEFKFTARSKPALTLDLGAIKASVLHSFRGDLSPVSEASTSGPTTPTTPRGAIPPFSKASYDAGSSAFLEPPVALTRSASFKDLRGMSHPEQTLPSSKTCFAIADVQLPSWFLAPADDLLPATPSTHTGMTPSASLPAYF